VVLERATGRRYADYLSEKVWKPIGASDAAVWLDRPGGLAKTFGGVLATASDWARVGLMLQNGGRVGQGASKARGYFFSKSSPGGMVWGAGIVAAGANQGPFNGGPKLRHHQVMVKATKNKAAYGPYTVVIKLGTRHHHVDLGKVVVGK